MENIREGQQCSRFNVLVKSIFMKFLVPVCIVLSLSFCSMHDPKSDPLPDTHQKDKAAPVAVVELFTSEGCSSCPPADRLLSKISAEAEAKGQNIISLAFHVDYWNHLGWKDPFSESRYSERQRTYAQKLNSQRVYTPQMVVNGTVGFVGSSSSEAREAIDEALNETPPVQISIDTTFINGQALSFSYRLSKLPENVVLVFALAESGLSREIKRGENGGRTLEHDHVVRAFGTQQPLETSGPGRLNIPGNAKPENMELVVYLQRKSDFKVLGAERRAIKKRP